MKQRFLKPLVAAAVAASFSMYSCASSDNMSDTTAMDESTTMSETQQMGGKTETEIEQDKDMDADVSMDADMSMDTELSMTDDVEIDAMFDDVADTKQLDVISLAKTSPNLSTFVKLVETAGLADMLSSGENYTIFAPTNEAFAKLSKEKLTMLMKPENKSELLKVLQLHVLSNEVPTTQFKNNQRIQVSEDKFINVSVDNTNIMIGGASIVRPDVEASNGVIHVLNGVVATTTDTGVR